MKRSWPALIALVVAAALAVTAGRVSAADELVLRDLEGREVRPLAYAGGAAFVFVRTDCPISGRYAPEIDRLERRATAHNLGFWLVFVDRTQTVTDIRIWLAGFGYAGAVLRDDDHHLVARAGATITPEAAVFAPDGRLVYRGRIDDRYVDFGRARPAPTRRDLDEVLAALEAGHPPAFRSTEAIGCIIADLR